MLEPVRLVTCAMWPLGEPGHEHLDAALAERGIAADWVGWDDPDVDWTDGLAAVRSTWDYEQRLDDFLAWSRSVPRLLNGSAVIRWNLDKRYLVELAEIGVPVVPTQVASSEAEVADAVSRWPVAVVKPTVGAGGRGLRVAAADAPEVVLAEPALATTHWLVQPLVESVRTEGEISVFCFGGRAVTQFRKVPASGEIRVHEHLGGTIAAVPLDAEAMAIASTALEAACDVVERHLDYARVDLMRLATGELALSELELVEPGLYLDADPANAGPYADLIQDRL